MAFCAKCGARLPEAASLAPASGGSAATSPIQFGGFWRRLLAAAVDLFLLGACAYGAVAALTNRVSGFNPSELLQTFALLFVILYWPAMESSPLQATLGKFVSGLKVVDNHGNRLGLLRAVWRLSAKLLSAIPLMIGFFRIGWAPRHQGTHDVVANTFVVARRTDAQQVALEVPKEAQPPRKLGPVLGTVCAAVLLSVFALMVTIQIRTPDLRLADEPLLTGKSARPIE